MGWQDRPYYRDRDSSTGGNPLMWLLTGSVPLFTIFGIRVRAHASLIVLIGLVLLLGGPFGNTVAARVQSMSVLFIVILLHEFGHCFAARYMGGSADEIMMTPLGGLAMAMAPRRPWATFVTVAGGPLVNVLICLVCAIGMVVAIGVVPIGFSSFVHVYERAVDPGWFQVSSYLFWFYAVSLFLLIFNLLPVFPLDGGQLLQSILWRPMGYYRSMLTTVTVGLVGAGLMIMVGIAMIGTGRFGFLITIIGIFAGLNCYRMRQMLKTEGPWAFQDEDEMDYGAAIYEPRPKRKWFGGIKARRARRLAQEEKAEQLKIDEILAKVSRQGMQSLTWWEKRTLRRATERQRERDVELSRTRRSGMT
jgi:stage IV sporulation protein FB